MGEGKKSQQEKNKRESAPLEKTLWSPYSAEYPRRLHIGQRIESEDIVGDRKCLSRRQPGPIRIKAVP